MSALAKLVPARVTASHVRYNASLDAGTLDIVSADGRPETYLLAAVRDAGGRTLGLRLLKLSDGAEHHVDLTSPGWAYDCPDALYRSGSPGGCRHVAALRQAAATLTNERKDRMTLRLLPYRCPECGEQLVLWDARTGETACPTCTRFVPVAAPAPETPDRRPLKRSAPQRRPKRAA